MAPTNKTNFKGNDVQARLLRAIVAAHPDVKWNYKGKPFVLPFCFLSGSSVCLSTSPPTRHLPLRTRRACVLPPRKPLATACIFIWTRGF
ncbi:hypothetical protein IMZ48_00400 [Candidatus Bathyarchaeota archaeon]|nr:hypothetical protein [Candidatus Bathyarchaeota archaeon]